VGGNQAAVSAGSGSNTAVVWGGYAAANLTWQFSRHWSAEGGVQFQSLGKYEQDIGTRSIALDLSKSLFATLSVGYKF
jgi:outer membrane scaffolding protein for murein synthesis (MipA/OmpV family)